MPDSLIQKILSGFRAPQKSHAEIDSGDAAPVSQLPDHIVGQISFGGPETAGVGMTGHKGLLCMMQNIVKSGVGQMGNVDNHTQAFHFFQKENAPFLQAAAGQIFKAGISGNCGILDLVSHRRMFQGFSEVKIGKSQFVLIIPGQRHHPRAQTVQDGKESRITPADPALFQCQKGSHLSLRAAVFNILPAFDGDDQITAGFRLPVKQVRHPQGVFQWILTLAHIHKSREILKKITALFHFFKINLCILSAQVSFLSGKRAGQSC